MQHKNTVIYIIIMLKILWRDITKNATKYADTMLWDKSYNYQKVLL